MAFGQVVFGGPELMDAADIQIMASNRLHPRSWVSGLHVASKYMPILAGRGIWHRYNHVTIPWDEPEAYRTLIHEWGHYALDLRDEYLESRQIDHSPHSSDGALQSLMVVIPNKTLSSTSIMATLEGTSELVPKMSGTSAKRKSEEWTAIKNRYPWLNPSPSSLEGPGRLPLPLPRFHRLGALSESMEAQLWSGATARQAHTQRKEDLVLRRFPQDLRLDRCWVYILSGMTSGQPHPNRIIAQGVVDARSGDDG